MTRSATRELNHSMPAAARAGLGTVLANLVTQVSALRTDLANIYLKNTFLLTAPTLALSSTKTKVKSTGAFSALVAGVVQSKSANTDMAVLAGTLATAKYAAWAFEIDSAGTLTSVAGTMDQASAAAAVAALPAASANKVRLGYIVVANASGENFVGATTNLDATGVTVTYVNATATPAMTAAALTALT